MYTEYDGLCGLVLTSPEVKKPNLKNLQTYFPDRELLLASDCPEISINTWVEVAELIIIMGRNAYTISYLMRRVLKAIEDTENEPKVYYYTNEVDKPLSLRNWTDYQCRYDAFKHGLAEHDNVQLSKETKALLALAPELAEIPIEMLPEYLAGYIADKSPAYDIELFSTPIEVEKMCTFHDREWNRKHGYSLDYATVHCEERVKEIYQTTLADQLKDYLSLRYYEEHFTEETRAYNQSSTRFICDYQKAKVFEWSEYIF